MTATLPGASNSGSSSALPIGTPTGATIDTTTYDNPENPGEKMTVLIVPGPGQVLGLAQPGDAFPRMILDGTGNIYFGAGDENPATNVCASIQHTDYLYLLSNGNQVEISEVFTVSAQQATFRAGHELLQDQPPFNRQLNYVEATGTLAAGSVAFTGGSGPPSIGGEVGDIYVRTDPGGALETIYRCTVAGGGNGYITSFALGASGSGYAVGDGALLDGGDNNAVVFVTAVGALGAVTHLRLGNRGSGYANSTQSTTSGTGTGLTVDITASTATWVGIV